MPNSVEPFESAGGTILLIVAIVLMVGFVYSTWGPRRSRRAAERERELE